MCMHACACSGVSLLEPVSNEEAAVSTATSASPAGSMAGAPPAANGHGAHGHSDYLECMFACDKVDELTAVGCTCACLCISSV